MILYIFSIQTGNYDFYYTKCLQPMGNTYTRIYVGCTEPEQT